MALPEDVRNGRKARSTPPNDSSVISSIQRYWSKSYAGDYLGLGLLFAAYILTRFAHEPFHQMFSLSDPRIQHPHAEVERVPVFYLFLYALIVPATLLTLLNLLLTPNLHKLHTALLALVTSVLTTLLLTDILKNGVGRPRPDLLDRCKPSLTTPSDGLVTVHVCTETRGHLLQDGFRSWPSGHSSFSFAGLGTLALFLASQTHVLRPRANTTAVILCLAPLIGATMVAVSRLEDYRHDVFDVTAGSLLGFGVALFNWRRYYPSLLARECDEPYGLSAPVEKPVFQRVRDEEEAMLEERYSLPADEAADAGGGQYTR